MSQSKGWSISPHVQNSLAWSIIGEAFYPECISHVPRTKLEDNVTCPTSKALRGYPNLNDFSQIRLRVLLVIKMTDQLPTLRWGIVATGLISSWFVQDLVLDRENAKAKHIVQAIGSSSLEKGKVFAEKYLPGKTPTIYGNYEELYADPNVDIVYIGTPHAFHKQNCLDAINAGKHVLCEKAFTLNAMEAKEVFEAAEKKGVFVMEAMWTRFFPLTRTLIKLLHEDKAIGNIHRVFCDFAMDQNIASLGPESRLKNPALGAGSLLDIGIYSLTWGLLGLDESIGEKAQTSEIVAKQTLDAGVDIATSAVLLYSDGKQAIVSSSSSVKTKPVFCTIQGSQGYVDIEGFTSAPQFFTVYSLKDGSSKKYKFERPGRGFYWEADAVALDITARRVQNDIMPWAETLRVLGILDEIRRQGGAKFPQDAIA
ncbi:NAD(P)-binding protein [Hypoxylon trugodes]|uniref:NAD(P)-binding protein n=1 Tax=Hypoxylon trugodes TaxID=326681 RepID=UPI00219BF9C7|nr:NAD(P)-binding protein [Hypoxylon trugodes]KAI1385481.1 NAD(P)-binding protein [Hypoxylon trugodes]